MRFFVDPAEVHQVVGTARLLGGPEVGEPFPDCFRYTLTVQERGEPFSVVLQGPLSREAQELVGILVTWFDRAMSAAPRLRQETSTPGPVTAAVRALAERLNIPKSAITVVSWEPVDWPDTSLGCPEPGMTYVQVITPGYRIVLEAEEKTYVAHTDRRGQRVVFCRQGRVDERPHSSVP